MVRLFRNRKGVCLWGYHADNDERATMYYVKYISVRSWQS